MRKTDKNNPLFTTIKNRYPLTKDNSSKQTWHVTLNLQGESIDFESGDSIGILPKNDPLLVEYLIRAMQADRNDSIIHTRKNIQMSLETFLSQEANLSRITTSFLKFIYEYEDSIEKKNHISSLLNPENKSQLREFLTRFDPLNLLRNYTKNPLPLQELCDLFGPLLPRFYSIASSKHAQKDEIDLTVALFTWTQSEEKRYGVTSHFLCHMAEVDKTSVPIFVQPAHHFRLPEDHHSDLIMIGPGTGIAPFRAFMQERIHHSSKANHWLFFGERNRKSDFFYENEWQQFKNLRVHTAFSRDQKEKVYVQHKMLENAKELYQWLQGGAHLYVCGDAKEMAKDVEKTLIQIVCEQEDTSPAQAKEYIQSLKKQKRYLLDVY